MRAWSIYALDATVILPSNAQTEAGFFLQTEPVAVVALGDPDELRRAVLALLARGIPRVPTPSRDSFPKPVVFAYAKVKTQAALDRVARCWQIEETASGWTLTPFAPDRVERIETHAAGSDAALADLVVSRLGARA